MFSTPSGNGESFLEDFRFTLPTSIRGIFGSLQTHGTYFFSNMTSKSKFLFDGWLWNGCCANWQENNINLCTSPEELLRDRVHWNEQYCLEKNIVFVWALGLKILKYAVNHVANSHAVTQVLLFHWFSADFQMASEHGPLLKVASCINFNLKSSVASVRHKSVSLWLPCFSQARPAPLQLWMPLLESSYRKLFHLHFTATCICHLGHVCWITGSLHVHTCCSTWLSSCGAGFLPEPSWTSLPCFQTLFCTFLIPSASAQLKTGGALLWIRHWCKGE
jgi:hypothetical protein